MIKCVVDTDWCWIELSFSYKLAHVFLYAWNEPEPENKIWSPSQRPQNQIDQLTMELGTEKSATQKLESGKLVLERQNKELKAKLAELETATRTKTKVR